MVKKVKILSFRNKIFLIVLPFRNNSTYAGEGVVSFM